MEVNQSETQQTQQEQTPIEDVKTQEPVKTQEEVDFSSRFAALSRKEKELRNKQKAWEEEYNKSKSQIDEYSTIKQIKEMAKEDPTKAMKVLEFMGMSFDDLAQAIVKDPPAPKDPEVMTLKQKLELMEKQLKEKEEKEQEAQIEYAVKEHKSKIKDFFSQQKDKYEFLNLFGEEGTNHVFDVIKQYYDENNGEVLSVDKACDLVENYFEKELDKFKGLNKVKKLFAIQEASQSKDSKSIGIEDKIPPTLTQKTIIPSAGENLDGLSHEEKIAKIAAKFKPKS